MGHLVVKLADLLHAGHEAGELLELGPLVVRGPDRYGHVHGLGLGTHGGHLLSRQYLSHTHRVPGHAGYFSDRLRARSATSRPYLASNAGRSERIGGIRSKLRSGGGHEVAHSRELPCPHGSSTSTSSP